VKSTVGLAGVFDLCKIRSTLSKVMSGDVVISSLSCGGISAKGLMPSEVKAFLMKAATGSEIESLLVSSFNLTNASWAAADLSWFWIDL